MKQVFRVMEVIEERTLECVCSVQRVAQIRVIRVIYT